LKTSWTGRAKRFEKKKKGKKKKKNDLHWVNSLVGGLEEGRKGMQSKRFEHGTVAIEGLV